MTFFVGGRSLCVDIVDTQRAAFDACARFGLLPYFAIASIAAP